MMVQENEKVLSDRRSSDAAIRGKMVPARRTRIARLKRSAIILHFRITQSFSCLL
jgi:hypothetical protein